MKFSAAALLMLAGYASAGSPELSVSMFSVVPTIEETRVIVFRRSCPLLLSQKLHRLHYFVLPAHS